MPTRRAELTAQYLAPRAERPASTARGVHHVALISSDVEHTVQFFQGILGFPLIEMFENRDYEGSTHFFFDIGHGNTLAYFDLPGLDLGPYQEVLGGNHHLAISVERSTWEQLKARLDAGEHRVRPRRRLVAVLPRSRRRASGADQRPVDGDVRQQCRLSSGNSCARNYVVSIMTLTVQRAADRFLTDIDWLDSKHSFNFGGHYREGDNGHGLLLVNNDDTVAGGGGFGTHGHRDMEIVTWVLSGKLEHRDSEGNHGVLYPGLAQRMSAGSGIRHSEQNASADRTGPLRADVGAARHCRESSPATSNATSTKRLAGGQLVPIASGKGHEGAVAIHQKDAVLWGGRLAAGATVELPTDEHVHVFVALGDGALSDGTALTTGDGVRITGEQALQFTAGDGGAELLVWATA